MSILVNIELEVIARVRRQGKEIKGKKIGKEGILYLLITWYFIGKILRKKVAMMLGIEATHLLDNMDSPSPRPTSLTPPRRAYYVSNRDQLLNP